MIATYESAPPAQPADARPAPEILAAVELALQIGAAGAAEQAARTLIGLFPDAVVPSILLGRALVEQQRWHEALDHFRWALATHPLDSAAWAGMAAALALGGRPREARAALGRAALHDPLDSQLLTPGVAALPAEGEGVSYLRQGHDQLAQATLLAVVARLPQRDDLRLYAIEALRRAGAVVEALAMLDALPADAPPTLPVLLLRAALNPGNADARREAARLDLDGQLTRRFFAPLRPPWDLLPPPTIALSEALAPIAPYLRSTALVPKRADTAAEPPAPRPGVPGDVRDFIATAERLRVRLVTSTGAPQPLLDHDAAARQTHLLLGCRAALLRRFGEDGFAAIDRRLRALADALQQRGVQASICYVDDAESLRLSDQLVLAPAGEEPAAIAALVRSAAQAFAGQGRELGTLLLVGGGECMPFFRLPNPLHDDDRELISDLPYGARHDGDLAPDLVVARVPDGGSLQLLLDTLDRMVARHAARPRGPLGLLRPRGAAPRAPWTLAQGYAAEVWREPARANLDSVHPPAELLLCPPTDAGSLDLDGLLGSAVTYVNLHGATGRSNWYGQSDDWNGPFARLPVALRPEQLAGRCVSGGLLLSEACFGMELAGRTVQNSIPLRALHEGVAACIGATVTAYGSYAVPLVGADLLSERMLAQLAAGAQAGTALRIARAEFAQAMIRRQGHLDDVDRKTLLSYVLYGDPWVTVAAPASPPHSSFQRLSGLLRPGRPRSAAPVDERQVPRELLGKVRATLRKVLPGAERARLAISARADLGLALKGDDPPDLVFSAQEPVPTDDGDLIVQAAHITVHRDTVVKIAVTR